MEGKMMATITHREIVLALRELGVNRESDVIAHVSLSAFGHVRGGAESMLGALLAVCGTVTLPTFTYQTMVWPEVGPPNNACVYGNHAEENTRAVMFTPDLPADRSMGQVAEVLRRRPGTLRSAHPVLSFAAAGAHAKAILNAQSLENPLGPLEWLHDHGGDVLLLGVDHRVNTAIHLAEKLAGRKQFVRWAVGVDRAFRLPGFPGCSNGFNAIAGKLAWITHQTTLGTATLQRLPLKGLVQVARQIISTDPLALLCDDPACERCNAVRQSTV
jgi:aminoglycoside 3-N-acetyltransferase